MQENPNPNPAPTKGWSLADKLIFRFLFVYFLIYAFLFPFDVIPGIERLLQYNAMFWDALVPWVGKNILNLSYPITVKPNGSGDTTYNYVQVLIIAVFALTISLIWTILDRRRATYNQLFYWFTVLLRYNLAFTMFVYGFAKVFKSQFPFPPLYRLLEPYGDSSPMGLLWTFMGYSYTYNVFTGLGEVVGGFFLLFRRTTTLGACILLAVLGNVVVINFAYDVPVKLYSVHLLLMAFILSLLDLPRLLAFFVLNVPTPPAEMPWISRFKILNFSLLAIKLAIIGFVSYAIVSQAIESEKKWGDKAPKPPFYGIYEVETFVMNRDTLPPLITDATRWRRLLINRQNAATVMLMNDSLKRYNFQPNLQKKTFLVYTNDADSTQKSTLTYTEPFKNQLVLQGILKKDTLKIHLKKTDLKKFLLLNRPFNWINEYPFNR
ncbi:MAG: hypothetical protein MUE85_23565 [Microscillaceae bacterium]|jgi:hypothetical protein|nr:hypothetical protein [Microscillaceae bacterium]